MHEQIEKAWLESGLAINTEGKIEDKQNNILGYYDALIHDPTSKTGKAIVDIKTVGDKKFNRILQQGHPEFEHQSQTNYYLWATGNKKSNGYIYYVNRDNPEQTFTMGFQFDESLLQQNLNTLNQARNEIYMLSYKTIRDLMKQGKKQLNFAEINKYGTRLSTWLRIQEVVSNE